MEFFVCPHKAPKGNILRRGRVDTIHRTAPIFYASRYNTLHFASQGRVQGEKPLETSVLLDCDHSPHFCTRVTYFSKKQKKFEFGLFNCAKTQTALYGAAWVFRAGRIRTGDSTPVRRRRFGVQYDVLLTEKVGH